ncbi:AAA domain-containing protein [Streptomyces sp. NPDC007369]|uniref:AAA domain-containing protein n=1 Tax=Streptomyces sp. NPDC007369 TaxID=3154589 RepID=UPI0033DFD97F
MPSADGTGRRRIPATGEHVLDGRYRIAGPPLSTGEFDILLPGRPAAPEEPDGPPRHLVLLVSRQRPGPETGPERGTETGTVSSGGPDAALWHRRCWEAELRTRREVAAVPGADRALLLHEATGAADDGARYDGHGNGHGPDRPGGHGPGRVTVFPAAGPPSTLAAALARRRDHSWLSPDAARRLGLWRMLARIADGIRILHEHRVCHRAIGPETVLLSARHGPDSARLAGLEWSLRLRSPGPARATPVGLHTAPEAADGGPLPVGPGADWYAFGVLAARCLLPVDARWAGRDDPVDRHRRLLGTLARSRGTTPLERDVLARLVAADPARRPTDGAAVRDAIRDAVRDVERLLSRAAAATSVSTSATGQQPTGSAAAGPTAGPGRNASDRPVTVVFDPRSRQLVEQCLSRGLAERLDPGAGRSFDAGRPEHTKALQKFLTDGFRSGAQLTPLARPGQWVLSSDRLHLLVTRRRGGAASPPPSDDTPPGGARGPDDEPIECVTALPYLLGHPGRPVEQVTGRIRFLAKEDYRRIRNTRGTVTSRGLALPEPAGTPAMPRRHEELLDHLRLTNQFELLLLDAELFRCEVAEVHLDASGRPALLRISELPRVRPPLSVLAAGTDMIDWLARRRNRDSQTAPVHLCAPDPETIARRAPSTEWEIVAVDTTDRTALLRPLRPVHDALPPGAIKVVRPADLHGQLAQVRRRQWAIDTLTGNVPLLHALTGAGAGADTGPGTGDLTELPLPLPDTVADEGKRRQLAAILRSESLYTLQGPPGTGKTHMTAWLLREILELDDSSRILVTAQAHPAVDVLRNKAGREALRGTGDARPALTVRLRGNNRTAGDGDRAAGDGDRAAGAAGGVPAPPPAGSEQRLVADVLADTLARLERRARARPGLSGTAREWFLLCRALQAGGTAADSEFTDLVLRAVAIVYTTTADRNLVALARAGHRFDWVIVEEAGKAHGFELALPLGLGRRWLMIGDPAQLPAYRMTEYQQIPAVLEDAMEILSGMKGGRRLADERLLHSWGTWSTQRRAEFAGRVEARLPLFGLLHDRYGPAEPDTGLLTGQYRMHPDIGELVSATFYGGRLRHRTRDDASGEPLPSVRHGLTAPAAVRDHAVVWLDLPWAAIDPVAAECDTPRYGNPAEALAVERFLRTLRAADSRPLELAVLTPYRRQVTLLRERFAAASVIPALAEAGITMAPDPLQGPRDSTDGAAADRAAAEGSTGDRAAAPTAGQGVFTVDSFQGNQARVVVVSLVRNNAAESGAGLGFLSNPARMNVLVSRAESLLVLVGSWAFLRHQVAEVPRDPESVDPLRYAAAFADTLDAWFASGRAVRIPADLTGLAGPPTSDRDTEDRYTEDRYTEDRYTEDRYTEDRYTEDRYTEDPYTGDPNTGDPSADADGAYADDRHPGGPYADGRPGPPEQPC